MAFPETIRGCGQTLLPTQDLHNYVPTTSIFLGKPVSIVSYSFCSGAALGSQGHMILLHLQHLLASSRKEKWQTGKRVQGSHAPFSSEVAKRKILPDSATQPSYLAMAGALGMFELVTSGPSRPMTL